MKLLDTFTDIANNVAEIKMHDSGKKISVIIKHPATKRLPEEIKECVYSNMDSAYSNRWVKRILKNIKD